MKRASGVSLMLAVFYSCCTRTSFMRWSSYLFRRKRQESLCWIAGKVADAPPSPRDPAEPSRRGAKNASTFSAVLRSPTGRVGDSRPALQRRTGISYMDLRKGCTWPDFGSVSRWYMDSVVWLPPILSACMASFDVRQRDEQTCLLCSVQAFGRQSGSSSSSSPCWR